MDWTSNLQISASELQGRVPVTVLHVEGRINMSNTDTLEQAAIEANQKGAQYILLDLNNVSSLTSAGLRAIHIIYMLLNQSPSQPPAEPATREAKDQYTLSPNLKLLVSSPEIRKVLQVSGFDSYIGVYNELQEAVSSF